MEGSIVNSVSPFFELPYSDIVDCIRENTFSLSSSLPHSKLNLSFWSSYMASMYLGMCHTFTYKNKENTDESTQLFILDPTLNYRIFIHDPKFYHLLIKSLFPRILLQYKKGKNIEAGTYDFYEISVTEHNLLNRPEQPCEEEEDYDFLQCVKTSQARMVGCRPPWDIWSPHTIPLCQTVDQLKDYEDNDWGLFMMKRKKKFLERTGCKIPCKYKVSFRLEFFWKLSNFIPGIQNDRKS